MSVGDGFDELPPDVPAGGFAPAGFPGPPLPVGGLPPVGKHGLPAASTVIPGGQGSGGLLGPLGPAAPVRGFGAGMQGVGLPARLTFDLTVPGGQGSLGPLVPERGFDPNGTQGAGLPARLTFDLTVPGGQGGSLGPAVPVGGFPLVIGTHGAAPVAVIGLAVPGGHGGGVPWAPRVPMFVGPGGLTPPAPFSRFPDSALEEPRDKISARSASAVSFCFRKMGTMIALCVLLEACGFTIFGLTLGCDDELVRSNSLICSTVRSGFADFEASVCCCCGAPWAFWLFAAGPQNSRVSATLVTMSISLLEAKFTTVHLRLRHCPLWPLANS